MTISWSLIVKLILGLAATLLLTTTAIASDASKQRATEAASLYLTLAGSCRTVVGSPEMFQAAIDDSVQTLIAGGYTEAEAQAATSKMVDAVAGTTPLPTTPDFCNREIKAITDGREALRAELAAAQ
jgi:hypothetical protein